MDIPTNPPTSSPMDLPMNPQINSPIISLNQLQSSRCCSSYMKWQYSGAMFVQKFSYLFFLPYTLQPPPTIREVSGLEKQATNNGPSLQQGAFWPDFVWWILFENFQEKCSILGSDQYSRKVLDKINRSIFSENLCSILDFSRGIMYFNKK